LNVASQFVNNRNQLITKLECFITKNSCYEKEIVMLISRMLKISALSLIAISLNSSADDSISFTKALEIIKSEALLLSANQKDVDALHAVQPQKNMHPNPSGTFSIDPVTLSEFSIGIEQTIERRGKKKARIGLINNEIKLKNAEKEILDKKITVEAIKRYLPIVFAQQNLTVIDSILEESSLLTEQIRKSVDAGAVITTDLIKSEIDIQKLMVEKQKVSKELERFKKYFASLGGNRSKSLLNVYPDGLPSIGTLPIDGISTVVEKTPESKLFDSELALMDSQKDVVNAELKPDLTVGVEYSRNTIENENLMLLSMSMDIPVFKKSNNELKKIEFQKDALRLKKENEEKEKTNQVIDLFNQIEIISETNSSLQNVIIPKLIENYSTVKLLYEAGKTHYRDLSEIRLDIYTSKIELIQGELEKGLLEVEILEVVLK
jgi:cobalt-zinc-cadmium efflux system outer membrane protein